MSIVELCSPISPVSSVFKLRISKSYLPVSSEFSPAKMTPDLEMKDTQASSSSLSASVRPTLQHLRDLASLIETALYTKEVRRIAPAVRLTFALRRKLMAPVLSAFLDVATVPGSVVHRKLSAHVPKESTYYLSFRYTATC
ncbi:hypothetical protein Nepgr_029186 [Nepenthes gracilis]|uniref:Uncharacterized protein n=1 Tax=Nepenthes gracilis TaxID=150966 RepID=A0AAD3Y323_NEPGR|nr:hypothetical protein Nepgr_029186 [Nepenthes gracilis]